MTSKTKETPKDKTREVYYHIFMFQLPNGKNLKFKAKVIRATEPVDLILKAEHVRRSIELDGVGNTQTCSMAVCTLRQAENFPHPVEGYVDWQYTRAFVVSKISKETGGPCECYVYEHDDNIGKLNDSKGGQLKLLTSLEKNGDRIISLKPTKKRAPRPGRVSGPVVMRGSHSPRANTSGARLRYVTAKLGGAFEP